MKPSDPKGLRMPSAEDGFANAKAYIERWERFNDTTALHFFWESLQTQIKIFYNLTGTVGGERVKWCLDCEKETSKALARLRRNQADEEIS